MDFSFPLHQKAIQMVNVLKETRAILDFIGKEYANLKEKYPEINQIEPEIKDLFSQQLFLESKIQRMFMDDKLNSFPSLSLLMLDTGKKIGLNYAITSHRKAVNKLRTGMKCIEKAVAKGEGLDIAVKNCINIKQDKDTLEGIFTPDTIEDLIKLGLVGYAGIQSFRYLMPILEKIGKEIKKRKR
jgi:hypothetical protein